MATGSALKGAHPPSNKVLRLQNKLSGSSMHLNVVLEGRSVLSLTVRSLYGPSRQSFSAPRLAVRGLVV